MKFQEIQLSPHRAALVEYDSSDPLKMEEALSREVSLITIQPVGGKEFSLRKSGSEYALTVTSPPTGPSNKFSHETLEGALSQVAEIKKAAEELERS